MDKRKKSFCYKTTCSSDNFAKNHANHIVKIKKTQKILFFLCEHTFLAPTVYVYISKKKSVRPGPGRFRLFSMQLSPIKVCADSPFVRSRKVEKKFIDLTHVFGLHSSCRTKLVKYIQAVGALQVTKAKQHEIN